MFLISNCSIQSSLYRLWCTFLEIGICITAGTLRRRIACRVRFAHLTFHYLSFEHRERVRYRMRRAICLPYVLDINTFIDFCSIACSLWKQVLYTDYWNFLFCISFLLHAKNSKVQINIFHFIKRYWYNVDIVINKNVNSNAINLMFR